jgi:hypothetical protein
VANLPAGGILPLDPPLAGLSRVLLRRLTCNLRVPPTPGVKLALVDTGAPLALFPHDVWAHDYGWQVGRDFDELSVPGLSLSGQVLQYRYSFRLARLRMPIVLSGKSLTGDRLQLDSLVCQFATPGGPPFIILGLWGGAFTNRRLVIDEEPGGDDLLARLEW